MDLPPNPWATIMLVGVRCDLGSAGALVPLVR
jgi:hypothetical protein